MASILSDVSNEAAAPSKKVAGGKAKKGGEKSIEELYQKKTQLEHILLRPDTYVGSIEAMSAPMWVLDAATKRIVRRPVTYVPGLFKIFDEIMVNAADNKQRDETMTTIKVVIDAEQGRISVWNDGAGIPVEVHSEHGCYVPELIFGQLLTGSNFDDDERKTTGGRNGYGAKLANIFSTEFVVETADSKSGRKLKQTWVDNMSRTKGEAVIGKHKGKDFTCVTFAPDLKRFKMDSLDEDTVALLSKRAYDVAASASCHGSKVAVYLNGEKIPVKSFAQYLGLHDGLEPPALVEKIDNRWTVGVGPSDGTFQQISFVNSICTTKGGTHVAMIADQLAAKLAPIIKKKNKGTEVKPALIKSQLAIYVDSMIVNPAFDSQTKETLTTKASQFGSKCVLSDAFVKSVEKSGVVERVLAFTKFKQDEQLKRKGGAKRARITGITKLDDANSAGGARGHECTLILTEGDSAKALAISGLGVVGRDLYGVFPLKGKPLNVREASHAAIMKNEEVQYIVQILGLRFGTVYDANNVKALRYGHLMIMTDQDHDGSHIKGLLINAFHHFWPSLLALKGFLRVFITPIVKAEPTGNAKRYPPKTFFTMPEYETWKEEHTDPLTKKLAGYSIKYYKGLGTSTSKEALAYFSDLGTHQLEFEKLHASDVGGDLIDMAFSKKRVEDRKTWLRAFEPGTFVDYGVDALSYDDFVNRELILFSVADNLRSIPNVIDGLKPSQRKVLFACFKRKLRREIKVAQLAGYVSEHAAYHHGEMSLTGTIVNMAQDFCGSNNLNLLTPAGQFGTRIMGGKDAASSRYIFTKLEPLARRVFHPDDDAVLDYLEDDGQSIEPQFYVPVIPLALVNGADGIGTGWSTSSPNFSPAEVIERIRLMIRLKGANLDTVCTAEEFEEGEGAGALPELQPWYRGFEGTIVPKTASSAAAGSYAAFGRAKRLDDVTVLVDELPVRKWTHEYKVWLEAGETGTEKDPAWIREFKENSTNTSVSFTITVLDAATLDDAERTLGGMEKRFKLESSISTSNMHFFDRNCAINKYNSPGDILEEFYGVRYKTYEKRKAKLVDLAQDETKLLSNKARFILAVVEGRLIVNKRKRADLLEELKREGYASIHPNQVDPRKQRNPAEDADDDDDAAAVEDDESSVLAADDAGEAKLARGYDYLLSMKILSLTMERVVAIQKQLAEKEVELAALEAKSEVEFWTEDLDALEAELIATEERRLEDQAQDDELLKNKKKQTSKPRARPKAPVKKAVVVRDEDDDEDMLPKPAAAKKAAPAAKKTVVKAVAAPKKPAAAKKPVAAAPKKKQQQMDFDDSDEEDKDGSESDESVVEIVAPKKPPARSRAPAKVVIEASDDDEDDFDDEEESDFEEEVAPKKKAAAKKTIVESDEDDLMEAAMDRLSVEPTKKKVIKRAPKKMIVESDDEEEEKVVAKKAPVKKAAPKKMIVESDEEESDFEEEEKVVAKKPPAKKAAPKKAAPAPKAAAAKPKAKPAPKKVTKKKDDSDDDDDDEAASESDDAPAPKKPPARARAPAKVVIDISDDEDDISDDEDDESENEWD